MNCSKCGAPVGPNEKFCPSCGAPVTERKVKKTMMATPGMLPGMLEELQKAGKIPPAAAKPASPQPGASAPSAAPAPAPDSAAPAPAPSTAPAPAPSTAPAPAPSAAPAPAPAPNAAPAPAPSAAPAPAPNSAPAPAPAPSAAPAPAPNSAPAPAPNSAPAPAPNAAPAPAAPAPEPAAPGVVAESSMNKKALALVIMFVLAAVFSVVSTFSNSWLTVSKGNFSAGSGLIKDQACGGDECKTTEREKPENNQAQNAYYAGKITYYYGFLNLALLGLASFLALMVFLGKSKSFGKAVKIVSVISYFLYIGGASAFLYFMLDTTPPKIREMLGFGLATYLAFAGFALVIAALFIKTESAES